MTALVGNAKSVGIPYLEDMRLIWADARRGYWETFKKGKRKDLHRRNGYRLAHTPKAKKGTSFSLVYVILQTLYVVTGGTCGHHFNWCVLSNLPNRACNPPLESICITLVLSDARLFPFGKSGLGTDWYNDHLFRVESNENEPWELYILIVDYLGDQFSRAGSITGVENTNWPPFGIINASPWEWNSDSYGVQNTSYLT